MRKSATDVIILPEDDAAATLKTVTGWVSRDGLFFGGDERTARWSGATHVRCSECGAVMEKGYTLCADCREKRDAAKFAALERREWDGVQMVYSETLERFFSDPDEAEESAESDGRTMEDLRLVLCDPVYAHGISGDHFADDLPEDGEVPDTVAEAMAVFNEAIKDIVLSWYPGKYALKPAPAAEARGTGEGGGR